MQRSKCCNAASRGIAFVSVTQNRICGTHCIQFSPPPLSAPFVRSLSKGFYSRHGPLTPNSSLCTVKRLFRQSYSYTQFGFLELNYFFPKGAAISFVTVQFRRIGLIYSHALMLSICPLPPLPGWRNAVIMSLSSFHCRPFDRIP